jgi:ribosomal protein S27AE
MAYVTIALSFGLAGGLVGRLKGSSFFLWFLISAVLPVVGLAAALLYRYDSEEPERPCPRCGKVVKLHDAICTRCGQELDYPGTAAPV